MTNDLPSFSRSTTDAMSYANSDYDAWFEEVYLNQICKDAEWDLYNETQADRDDNRTNFGTKD